MWISKRPFALKMQHLGDTVGGLELHWRGKPFLPETCSAMALLKGRCSHMMTCKGIPTTPQLPRPQVHLWLKKEVHMAGIYHGSDKNVYLM
jgi:hypothetical protein